MQMPTTLGAAPGVTRSASQPDGGKLGGFTDSAEQVPV